MDKQPYDYVKAERKYGNLLGLIIILFLFSVIIILFAIIGLIAALPLGLIIVGLLVLYYWWVSKLIKKAKNLKQEIKVNKPNLPNGGGVLGNTVYCFVSPYSTKETVELICKALPSVCGVMKEKNDNRGYIKAKIPVKRNKVDVEFYIKRAEQNCNVRVLWKKMADDYVWDVFLTTLHQLTDNADLAVTCANGDPYAIALLYLGGELEEVQISRTVHKTSIMGALIGGALFGDAGFVLGGMSGPTRTYGHSYERFADSHLVRIMYNNGRIWEGTLKKGSKLYNDIMVNFAD